MLLNNSVGKASDFNDGTIRDDELLRMVIYDSPSYTVAAVQPVDTDGLLMLMDAAETGVQCDDVQCDGVQCDDIQCDGSPVDAVVMLDLEDCTLDDTSLLFS